MKSKNRRESLARKINVTITALMAVLCLFVAGLTVLFEARNQSGEIASQGAMLLSSMSASINSRIAQTEIVVHELLGTKSIATFLRAPTREKRIIQFSFRVLPDIHYAQTYLMELNGRIRILTADPSQLVTREYVLDDGALRGEAEYAAFFDGAQTSRWLYGEGIAAALDAEGGTASFCYKVFRGVNNPIGVVACSVSLEKLFASLDYWTGEGTVAVVGSDGGTVYARGSGDIDVPGDLSPGFSRRGGSVFVAAEIPDTDLRIALAMDDWAAYGGLRSSIWRNIAIVVAGFILIWIGVRLAVRQTLVRLERLTEAVQRMPARGYEGICLPESGPDEVGRLSAAFNQLLNEINDSYGQLLNKEHEKRRAMSIALQYQMNPHFLFNSLYALQLKAEQAGMDPKLCESISLLGRVLHYNMDGSAMASIAEEEAHIRAYVDFLNIVRDSAVALETDVPLKLRNQEILRFSLQPVIENSFKHGWVAGRPFHIFVRFCQDAKAGLLYISVENDGRPINPAQLAELRRRLMTAEGGVGAGDQRGVGLRNLAQRLRMNYGPAARLDILSDEARTRVEIVVPMRPRGASGEGGLSVENTDC